MMIQTAIATTALALFPALATHCTPTNTHTSAPTVIERDECDFTPFNATPPDTITITLLLAETDCDGNPATHQQRCDDLGGTLRIALNMRFCDDIDF